MSSKAGKRKTSVQNEAAITANVEVNILRLFVVRVTLYIGKDKL